jgi:parallel beta-helix repeat protein
MGIFSVNSNTNFFHKNNIYNMSNSGIALFSSYGNNISENTLFTISDQALVLFASDENLIQGNIVYNNTGEGILLMENCKNNLIKKNLVEDCGQGGGIVLWGGQSYSRFNILEQNRIMNNQYGINCVNVSDNIFYNNIVEFNSRFGFALSNSSNNSVFENEISNNLFGIILRSSTDNAINYNNLFENRVKAFFIDGCNSWDCNYWNRPRILPKVIFGVKMVSDSYFIPCMNVDWHPAQDPFEISIV